MQQFHSLISIVNRANVRVYAVDASGLMAAGRQDAARSELEQAMQTAGEEMESNVGDHEREQKNAISPERVKSMERGEQRFAPTCRTPSRSWPRAPVAR